MSTIKTRLNKLKEQLNIGNSKVRLTIMGEMKVDDLYRKGYFKDLAEKEAYTQWIIKRKQEEEKNDSPYIVISFDESFLVNRLGEFRASLLEKEKNV